MRMQLPATRFLTYSLAGIVTFFVPVSIGGSSTILIDHVVGFLTSRFMPITRGYTAVLISAGCGAAIFFGRLEALPNIDGVVRSSVGSIAAGG